MTIPDESAGVPVAPPPDDRLHGARAALHALQALLNLESDEPAVALEALRPVFAFDRALLLEERDGVVHCIAAKPDVHTGLQSDAAVFFRTIVAGHVCATGPGRDTPELPADLIAPAQPALCMPVALREHCAALVLTRAEGESFFSDDEIAIARQCAAVSLATLAVRSSGRAEAEIARLTALVEELRQGEANAQHNSTLLHEIVNHLPVGLTVQDEHGRFILVNAIAAANLATPLDALIGASPADFLSQEDAAIRREWELGIIRSGQLNTVEENVAGEAGEQTWLTSHTPLNVLGHTLLLTSSLEITERKRIENDLAKRVHFDDLTGFPNRLLIQHHVEDILQRGGVRFALAFIDIDNFKHINDYYSHAVGDALLVKIAQRIANRLRGSDMLARISGDEFLLLIEPVDNDEDVRVTIDGIRDDLKQPFYIEAYEIFTSASIGVSIHPDHGKAYEDLRRNADNAMYRAKTGSKGGAIYFDLNMGQKITARMEQEQRLRLAIRDRRFCCAFQPKVDIRTQEVVGFETLVRWRDDAGEIQPPSSFIGLAIELGLIDPITQFVMTEALASIESLDDAFGAHTTISINVAAKQAGDLEFMRTVAETLAASPYAKRIMLEVTEEAFVEKSKFQTQVLPLLREIGVRVSIDDFGTGHSSLSALADITADEIKVDRSFIVSIHERPRSQSVLRAIESLGQALGMSMVAEGVETFEELAYLQAATRIRCAQGYYFAKPFFLYDAADAKRVSFSERNVETTRENSGRRSARASRGE